MVMHWSRAFLAIEKLSVAEVFHQRSLSGYLADQWVARSICIPDRSLFQVPSGRL